MCKKRTVRVHHMYVHCKYLSLPIGVMDTARRIYICHKIIYFGTQNLSTKVFFNSSLSAYVYSISVSKIHTFALVDNKVFCTKRLLLLLNVFIHQCTRKSHDVGQHGKWRIMVLQHKNLLSILYIIKMGKDHERSFKSHELDRVNSFVFLRRNALHKYVFRLKMS